MKLYTNGKGQWVGTQVDARKQLGKIKRTVEVPVDKSGLMAFLNTHRVIAFTGSAIVQEPPKPDLEPTPELLSPHASSWVAWSLDTLKRGDTREAEAMLVKGLTIQNELTKGVK
tara:strand:- start:302 stop:643 length:342 start_codon:yes stop_codon:yes gene_type:complete